jgi:hypothetical protein
VVLNRRDPLPSLLRRPEVGDAKAKVLGQLRDLVLKFRLGQALGFRLGH